MTHIGHTSCWSDVVQCLVGPSKRSRKDRWTGTPGRKVPSPALWARGSIHGEQRREVAQVDVAVAVHVAVLGRRAAGHAVVGQQLGQIGEINVAVAVQVARARR